MVDLNTHKIIFTILYLGFVFFSFLLGAYRLISMMFALVMSLIFSVVFGVTICWLRKLEAEII